MLGNPSAPQEGLLQQLENIAAQFPDGIDETSDADETPRLFKSSDASRDLLEKADHPKHPLCKIVREGHFRLLDEQNRFALVLAESLMKIGGLGLLPPSSRAFLSRFGGRKLRLAGGENGPVAPSEEVDPLAGNESARSRVLGSVHLREQIEHLLRPPLGLVLEGRPKLPKEMRAAQRIPTHPSDAGRLSR